MQSRLTSNCIRDGARRLFWPVLGNTYKWSRSAGKATEGLQTVMVSFNISPLIVWSSRVQTLLDNLLRNFDSHGRRSLTTLVTVPCVTGVLLTGRCLALQVLLMCVRDLPAIRQLGVSGRVFLCYFSSLGLTRYMNTRVRRHFLCTTCKRISINGFRKLLIKTFYNQLLTESLDLCTVFNITCLKVL
jgi:hypothetical protein